MQKIADSLSCINEMLGRAVSWLSLGMVLMMFWNVVQRYLFSTGQPWEQEIVTFMHAALFLAAAGYTLKHDKHVRVDIVYARLSPYGKAWTELLGTLFFLFPVCGVIVYYSWDFVLTSWQLREASPEYNGMQGVYLLKTCIWIFSGSLILQGCATMCSALATIREGRPR